MKTVADVMNRNFFHASPSDTIGVLLQQMAERGLGCVAVLNLDGKPGGVATTAEIERCYDAEELADNLQRAAVCMEVSSSIDVAARAGAAPVLLPVAGQRQRRSRRCAFPDRAAPSRAGD